MKKTVRFFFAILLCFALLLLCSCSRTINNYADELIMNTWKSSFENGNVIELFFSDDNATLTLSTSDNSSVKISGFCEVSDDSFVIHDTKTEVAYPFNYVVHFDSVDIIYEGNTVSLGKI